MKKITLIATLFVAACATNPSVQNIYDTRMKDPKDKELAQSYAKGFIDDITAAGAIPFGSSHSIKSVETTQKYICACHKKLGNKCQQAPAFNSAEDKDLWAKSNGAEIALHGTGNGKLTDRILCD